jgi:hypothetical protein
MQLKMQPTIHLERQAGINIQLYLPNVLWVAFSSPSGSLLLLNHLVFHIGNRRKTLFVTGVYLPHHVEALEGNFSRVNPEMAFTSERNWFSQNFQR